MWDMIRAPREEDPLLNLFQRPELLSKLLAGMQDGLSVADLGRKLVYVNDALCKMFGFNRAELTGTSAPFPYWPAEEIATIEAAFQRTMREDVANFELTYQRKDGTRIEVIVAPGILHDEDGKAIAYFATIKDISERKRLERSLLASEQRWRSIAENPYDFVVLIDRDYRYTYVNHTAPGISQESLLGRATPFEFADAQYHDAMRASFETTFKTGRATSYEVYVPQLDKWYSSIVGAVFEQGRVNFISILTREITQQKRAEETLRRSEQRLRDSHKMETIGTLAGGIAHDINNMLTPILAYADLAKQELPQEHSVQEHLEGISIASQRARELVRRVLLFSRRQEPRKAPFDLRQSVSEDILLLKASLPASIQLATELPMEPVFVFGDRAQLGQVLTNLATNALQAMQDTGGKLTIALEQAVAGEAVAILSVTDTGPGMDAETVRRAFEPFFTTKSVGSGTGLGLSIVHSVVQDHGGETLIQTAPGQGSAFTVRLPITPAMKSDSDQTSTLQPSTLSMRVLVVDDESAIVEIVHQVLTRAGHVVTTATSAQEALDIFARQPDAFDVLFTDQSMPNMMGTTLVEQALAIRPALRCILMTGLCDEATQRRARAAGVVEIISKPFALAALAEAVQRAGFAKSN